MSELGRHNFSSRCRVCGPEGANLQAVTRTRRMHTKDKTEEESETPCGIFKVVQVINL
jgi:hypothetical protein